jgi:hypothetical protein
MMLPLQVPGGCSFDRKQQKGRLLFVDDGHAVKRSIFRERPKK